MMLYMNFGTRTGERKSVTVFESYHRKALHDNGGALVHLLTLGLDVTERNSGEVKQVGFFLLKEIVYRLITVVHTMISVVQDCVSICGFRACRPPSMVPES